MKTQKSQFSDHQKSEQTTAKDIMSTHLVYIAKDTTIEEALKVLINHKVTGVPVLDHQGKMDGVVSEFDLLTQISKSKKMNDEVFNQTIQYSKKVDSVTEDTPLDQILSEFVDSKFRRLPVVDRDKKLVGIITRRDLIRIFYYRARLGG